MKLLLNVIIVKQKNRVLSQAKKLKGTNLFINEQLTHKNAELGRLARQYKKHTLMQSTWIINSKNFYQNDWK